MDSLNDFLPHLVLAHSINEEGGYEVLKATLRGEVQLQNGTVILPAQEVEQQLKHPVSFVVDRIDRGVKKE